MHWNFIYVPGDMLLNHSIIVHRIWWFISHGQKNVEDIFEKYTLLYGSYVKWLGLVNITLKTHVHWARLGKHDLENSCTLDEIVLNIDMKYFPKDKKVKK